MAMSIGIESNLQHVNMKKQTKKKLINELTFLLLQLFSSS